jgi:archaellum component FlaG (FlaF/FlaG flagellin family)
MANVFGILTAIVLALAGLVAYQNKAAYELEIANTSTVKSKLEASQKRLKLAEDTYTATLAKRTGIDEEIVKLQTTEADLTKANVDLTSAKEDLTAKIDTNKSKSDESPEKTGKLSNFQDDIAEIRKLNTELEELAQLKTSAATKLENLTALNSQTEAHASAIKKKFEIITSGQSLPTLKTQIRAIYPTWGFVTLASGNQAGVVANSTLEVVRDGTVIGKLLVTSVEANSASASIIPDSLAQDVTLMIGDRVIATIKPVVEPKPAAPSPPPAPKPADPATPPADPAAPATDPAEPAAPEPAAPTAPDPLAPAAP